MLTLPLEHLLHASCIQSQCHSSYKANLPLIICHRHLRGAYCKVLKFISCSSNRFLSLPLFELVKVQNIHGECEVFYSSTSLTNSWYVVIFQQRLLHSIQCRKHPVPKIVVPREVKNTGSHCCLSFVCGWDESCEMTQLWL